LPVLGIMGSSRFSMALTGPCPCCDAHPPTKIDRR
jgi:hypothetical protein